MIAHDLELVVVTGIFKSFVLFIAVLHGFVVLIGTTAILTSFISLLQFHSLLFSFASRLLNRLRHDFQQVFIDYRRCLFCRASPIFNRQQRAGLLLCIVAVSADCREVFARFPVGFGGQIRFQDRLLVVSWDVPVVAGYWIKRVKFRCLRA